MNESEREFHLDEYRQLKQEAAALLGRIETLARLGIVVPAAVYSWLAIKGFGRGVDLNTWCTTLPADLFKPAWMIPFAFALLSGLGAFSAYWRGRQMGAYLRSLESVMAARGLGWEQKLNPKFPILTIAGGSFWVALLLGTFVVGWRGWAFVDGATAACAHIG